MDAYAMPQEVALPSLPKDQTHNIDVDNGFTL